MTIFISQPNNRSITTSNDLSLNDPNYFQLTPRPSMNDHLHQRHGRYPHRLEIARTTNEEIKGRRKLKLINGVYVMCTVLMNYMKLYTSAI